MFHSIRWRIALPYILLILATMLVVGIYLSYFFQQFYYSSVEYRLASDARFLADQFLTSGIMPDSPPKYYQNLVESWGNLLDARVTLIAPDGTVVGDTHESPASMENHLNRPEIRLASQKGIGSNVRYSTTLGYRMFYVAVPIKQGEKLTGFIRLAIPFTIIEAAITTLQRNLIILTIAASLLAILLAIWIANRTTGPLRNLSQAIGRISGGDFQSGIIPTSSDEVGQISQAFISMVIQLEAQKDALDSERSKTNSVLSNMNDGVIIVDSSGNVQLINQAVMNLFGIQQQDALGRSLIENFRLYQLVELWEKSIESIEPQVMNLEIPSRQLYFQGIAIPLGQALPGNTLLMLQNLTRIRHLETVRRDFISNISHELRTPLASLKALTETLKEGALEDPPAATKFLDQMETEVDSMSLMVTELLELSRIESGRVPFQFETTFPPTVITEAVDRLRLQAGRAGLTLEINLADDLPFIQADQSRLEQVLVNLLHNAIKFTPVGGKIIVEASPYNESHEQYVLFSVKDTGIGIPDADLGRIFERFYKADRARSGSGTGLGLAIARHTVEAHNGRIWAESEKGLGSSFYFTIPVTKELQSTKK